MRATTPFLVLITMRPYQWVKNLIIFAPLIFAEKLYDTKSLLLSALGFALFCLASGSVYLLNDIVDADADRAHPLKRLRPIASGKLPARSAKIAIAVIILLVVSISALVVQPLFTAVILLYAMMNVAYSLKLKHIAFLDVTIIALGFITRVVSGALIIDVRISPWLIGCTFLVSLYLALGKRVHELAAVSGGAPEQRRVLRFYNVRTLDRVMPAAGLLTLAAYVFYTLSEDTVQRFGSTKLVFAAPLIAVGLIRFFILAHKPKTALSPTDAMLRDPLMIGVVLLWGVSVVAIIYSWL